MYTTKGTPPNPHMIFPSNGSFSMAVLNAVDNGLGADGGY